MPESASDRAIRPRFDPLNAFLSCLAEPLAS